MSGKAVAIIGSGVVGETLANGFLKHGFKVCQASRDPSKLSEWLSSAEPKGQVTIGTFEEACKCSDIVVLAAAGPSWESVLEHCGLDNLKGKIIIDAMNPISGGAEDGVLEFSAGVKDSLMEMFLKENLSRRGAALEVSILLTQISGTISPPCLFAETMPQRSKRCLPFWKCLAGKLLTWER